VRARPGVARLVDSDGNDVHPGTPGELCLQAKTLFQGYWNAPGTIDAARDAGGWFHTGDLLRQDERGELHYVARIKEIIVRDGENIAPAEIEGILLSHPDVAEAAVVGVPEDEIGERIVGFIKLADTKGHATSHEILRWLGLRLADHKVPERLLLVERIPRTVFGKPDRRALRAQAVLAVTAQLRNLNHK
jgi:acyl-CoA synthetase (AMP-forming)/AMP-acid ligase II